jgi:signal-transduction protein with cAMP-binding, CBS, and nucleotidyltransferase domain
VFNIHSDEEWNGIGEIVVNEDGMKMPIARGDSEASIVYKFMMNPSKIDNLDDLYDAFEVNKNSNVKYVVMCNPGENKSPSDMTLQ